jgi:hypothetical protein
VSWGGSTSYTYSRPKEQSVKITVKKAKKAEEGETADAANPEEAKVEEDPEASTEAESSQAEPTN